MNAKIRSNKETLGQPPRVSIHHTKRIKSEEVLSKIRKTVWIKMKFQNQNLLNISYILISLLPCFNCLQIIKFEFKSPDFESVSQFHHLLMLGLNTV